MFRLLQPLIRSVIRRAMRQGVVEGSLVWVAVGAAALVARLIFRPEEPKIVREKLKLGETLVVTHREAPKRESRRRRNRK